LNLLTASIQAFPGSQIGISTLPYGAQVKIKLYTRVDGQGRIYSASQSELDEKIEMARQLLALSNGTVLVNNDAAFSISLFLPSAEGQVVVVIDDNADTLRLFQSCLAGSRFPFFDVQDPHTAMEVVQQLTPRFVILDVMLPGIDGWELLSRLREHPLTKHIPIIVCTILPQEQLALTLGAVAYLRKPFTRAELLALLDRLADQPEIMSDLAG
ncbi:MAG: response regulator, partial [Anaerolineae bacterium]|nr:response regulator [Anaerolineae bacterium]